MSFDPQYINKVAVAKSKGLNIRKLPATTSEVLLTKVANQAAGRLTGSFFEQKDGRWYHILLYTNDSENLLKLKGVKADHGYVRFDVITLMDAPPQNPISITQDKGKVNDQLSVLVKSDQAVFNKLVRCRYMINLLASKGVNTEAYSSQLNKIVANYSDRQLKLSKNPALKLSGQMANVADSKGKTAGWPMVLEVVVLAAIGTALILMIKSALSESTIDNKLSDELEAVLKQKLTEPEYNKLKSEIDEKIKLSYAQGKKDGGGIMKTISNLLFGAGLAFMGYKLVTSGNNSRK